MRPLLQFAISLAVLCSLQSHALGQTEKSEREDLLEIDEQRLKVFKKLGVNKIPDPDLIRKTAQALFAKPVAQQNSAALEEVAALANRYVNFIGYIGDRYDKEYRSNYRYDFVQKAMAGPTDKYSNVGNEFKAIRSSARLRIMAAIIESTDGRRIAAFFRLRLRSRLSHVPLRTQCSASTAPRRLGPCHQLHSARRNSRSISDALSASPPTTASLRAL